MNEYINKCVKKKRQKLSELTNVIILSKKGMLSRYLNLSKSIVASFPWCWLVISLRKLREQLSSQSVFWWLFS